MHLKNTFLSHHQPFCWSPKSHLKVFWMSQTLGTLGDLQGTSPGRCVLTGVQLEDIETFCPPEISSSLRFSNLICLAKKLLWLEENENMLDKKAFSKIAILITKIAFFIINSDNQEFIHHAHYFEYIFCHQNKAMKFCWFNIFLSTVFTLNFIYRVSYTSIIQ